MAEEFIDRRRILTDLSEKAIDRVFRASERVIREYWARYKNRDAATYGDYLDRKGALLSSVRNIIYTNKSTALYDIYVPSRFLPNDRTADQIINMLCENIDDPKKRPTHALTIVGGAGAGKSFFMRHAFFHIQNIGSGRIPIFLEPRSFNRMILANLETRIFDDFTSLGTSITREQITVGLRSGLFVLLLDGIDELKIGIQSHYLNEISDFIKKFPLCPILISSRPSQKFHSLPTNEIVRIGRMTEIAATDLIGRLEYADNTKNAFIKLLRGGLYNTHYDYVSIPLLCTIMLLTFSDSGRISSKRHEFYEDAFLALWSKHDIRKEGFEREKFSGLQKKDFLRLVAAFAVSSYGRGDYEMRDSDLRRHFEQAISLSGITCQEDEFIQDLTISTCLAIEDGPYIRFCHRSFQEYFAALFLSETDDAMVGDLIEEFSDRIEMDNVLQLALSLNPEKVEKNWVLNKVDSVASSIRVMGDDIGNYVNMAVGQQSSNNELAIVMQKIRILYQFSPNLSALLAAYDAAKHMGVRVGQITNRSPRGRLFEKDRSNFRNLSAHLAKKYRNQSSALQTLLRWSAEASKEDRRNQEEIS
ncbi:NACHT domain-containing protein [Limobrevibacterium gyesilva]|uniref:NACHT domain-containing protein n=1 Tax=Limobrevibacterium gyesilva TaxID=2991712 RepID=A0AA42CGY3_9PROT|nr:NACHT domain-containing protein [Limobrevibacterium gyesilva]MCW3474305.1 NACHT domain-containing protein [Limobrevibacterium gyesilva]